MPTNSFSHQSFQTTSGTVTPWLLLSTQWPSTKTCSSQLYSQARVGGKIIAFDPFYCEVIGMDATPYLPPEVTAWWHQRTAKRPTTTLLGPTSIRTGAYAVIQIPLVNSHIQQIICCPLDVPHQLIHVNTKNML
jgi:hypothetical protein